MQDLQYYKHLNSGGVAGAPQENLGDVIDRVNALYGKVITWAPYGFTMERTSPKGFIGYAYQDSFPFLNDNIESMTVLDVFQLFHNPDLESDGIDQLIIDDTPNTILTNEQNMLLDLTENGTHQEKTSYDWNLFILGDDTFSEANSTLGIMVGEQLLSVDFDNGLKSFDFQEFLNLFDVNPTRMAILRLV